MRQAALVWATCSDSRRHQGYLLERFLAKRYAPDASERTQIIQLLLEAADKK